MMIWFTNLKTRNKLLLSFAAVVACLGLTIGFALRGLNDVHRSTLLAQVILQMEGNVHQQQSDMLRMLLGGSEQLLSQTVDHIEDARRANDRFLAEAETLIERETLAAAFADFTAARATHNDFRDRTVLPALVAGDRDASEAAPAQLEPRFQRLSELGEALRLRAVNAAESTVRRVLATCLAASILTVLLTMGIVVFLTRLIAHPLDQIAGTASRIAEGDIAGIDAEQTRSDEVGKLAHAFARMTTYLRDNAAIADRIASGNLSVTVEPRSSRDVLGERVRAHDRQPAAAHR